ncbi:MAG: AraC family transcriptional regulator [Actinomycetota bacterium]|nr:AraC family transcriptional regulator [Actinomycetota bacterium]
MFDDDLRIRAGLDGRVVRHMVGDIRPRPHRHAELELNLVVRGTSSYLLGERRYELTSGTLTWLFPDQGHVLVDESADHELWWAVFRPGLVTKIVATQRERPLLQADPVGRFSRRLAPDAVRRLATLLREVRAAESTDGVLANAGLAYLLILAWRLFLESNDIVEGIDLHPAVETVANLLRADPNAGDLARLAEAAALSPSHLSRLFKAQTGVSISRFRNQLRLERFLTLYGRGKRTTALEAALEAGFGSYAQFYRVFREHTGRRPAAIRASAADDDLSVPSDTR